MKIYTRTGDRGDTALFGGDRVRKSHPRIEAYGTVDETNSAIGLARSFLRGQPGEETLDPVLARIQAELFVAGADLATPTGARPVVPRVETPEIEALEREIDRMEENLPELRTFILPGGTAVASQLHVARTICRRAERLTVDLDAAEPVNEHVIVYLNRLSDFLFVTARWVNKCAGAEEDAWTGKE
jgi:cob(I)alamin adenosyltransferase